MRAIHRLAFVALALGAAACSESAVGPSQPVDLPTALSEMSISSIAPLEVSSGVSVPSLSVVPSRCSYDAALQSFACAPLTSNGFTITSAYTLLSASGAPQSAFDAATTAAIRTTTTLSGSTVLTGDTLHLDAHQTMTLSGLLTGHHLLDGTQVAHMTGHLAGSSLDETMTTTIAGLIPPTPGSANPYPGGGSIIFTMVDASFPAGTVTMTMVFNGTSKVDVTISAAGLPPQHCTIDLANAASGGSCGIP